MIILKTTQAKVNIIESYATTADKDVGELEQFYSELEEALNLVKSREVTIIMRDLNAKKGEFNEISISLIIFNYEIRNEKRERLAEFGRFCSYEHLL